MSSLRVKSLIIFLLGLVCFSPVSPVSLAPHAYAQASSGLNPPSPSLSAQINNVFYIAGFNTTLYPGIGVAQTAWSSGTYPLCTAVSNSGSNFLAAGITTGITPGTNSAIWYPVQNANTPTAGDCAFYLASAANTGGANRGQTVILPPGNTNTCIGWTSPTVGSGGNPGNPTINIFGSGKSVSVLTQSCSISAPTLQQPTATTPFFFASFDWEGFTINSNFNAPHVCGVYGAQQFTMRELLIENPADGSDSDCEFGLNPDSSNVNWDYEGDLEDIDIASSHGSGKNAVITVSVSGGNPTFTVSNGGTGYNAAYVKLILSGPQGNTVAAPCSSRGTDTIMLSGTSISSITSTASGCGSTVYAVVYGAVDVNYGLKFGHFTDSKMVRDITDGGVGAIAATYVSPISSQNKFYNLHPIAPYIGVQDFATNNYYNLQCDTIWKYCFESDGQGSTTNIYGTVFEWNNQTQLGSSDYHLENVTGAPSTAPLAFNVFGDTCANAATFNGYAHIIAGVASVDSGTPMPNYAHFYDTTYCNNTSTINKADFVGTQFSWSPGGIYSGVPDGWQFVLGGGANATMEVTGFLNGAAPNQGVYNWQWQNLTSATNSLNPASPDVESCSAYWNGSASVPLCVSDQLTFASGSGPLATHAFTFAGTAPSGGEAYSFDQPITITASGSGSLALSGSVSGTTTLTVPTTGTPYTLEIPSTAPSSGTFLSCTAANPSICSWATAGTPAPFTITPSASPAINLNNGSVQTITLNANATATVSNISSGISLTMQICQPASGGPYTWAWPAAIHGGLTIGTMASTCSMQEFRSFNGTTFVPLSSGAINVAP